MKVLSEKRESRRGSIDSSLKNIGLSISLEKGKHLKRR